MDKREVQVKVVYNGIVAISAIAFMAVVKEIGQQFQYYELTGHTFWDHWSFLRRESE